MSLTDEEVTFARELFAGLGGVSTRRMFGGVGLYRDGTIFAVMRSDGVILLKGAGDFISEIEAAGGTRWTHDKGTMPYWSLPEEAMDDPEVACDWARRALVSLPRR